MFDCWLCFKGMGLELCLWEMKKEMRVGDKWVGRCFSGVWERG